MIAMRKAGQRPAGFVFVSYGDFREPDWWRWANTCNQPELLICPEDPIERLDLRCAVDLSLILFFYEWSEPAGRLFDRLTEYAQEIAVESPDFGTDIGWWWTRETGRIEFNDLPWVLKFHEARKTGCYTKAQLDDRIRIENECVKHVPSLRGNHGDAA
ncbi:MAG: hypothetical protein NT083_00320 [Rhodocyclales bacterium]|nr:hypothetical protein [Rhodocyclales bacterium]